MYMNIHVERGEGGAAQTVHLWDDVDGYLKFPYAEFAYAYRRNEAGEKVSLYGHNVTKIFSWAKNDTTVMESDLPPETRVLTDTYLESDDPSIGHRILFFDIEVDSKNGYPRVETASNELYSIAMYDGITQEYTILAVNNPARQAVNIPEANVIMFDSEEEMLTKFLDLYETIAPTVISGWNSDGFDVPYLYERLKRVFGKHEANRLSPIGIVKYSRSKETYQIAGVSSLDYRWLYKKFTYTEMPNYRLDTIGREELGISKVEYDSTLDVLYETDLEKFLKYNMRDVEILVKLNDKLKLIALVQSICHIGHVPYEEYWYSSRYIDGAILTYLHRKGIIAPNKPEGGDEKYKELKDSDEEGFIGAFVKEVTPGLHSWVYSLDLQSLYPSLIMSLNVSPEAKVGKISNWDMEKHIRKQINEYILTDLAGDDSEKMSPADFAEFMKEGEFSINEFK